MTALSRVHKEESKRAKEILLPFRSTQVTEWCLAELPHDIHITGERADRLEQAICEALVEAYNRGKQDGIEEAHW